jgi:hypothetical protein
MVTTGSEGQIAADFHSTHESASIDYAACHIWVENWRLYHPDDPSDVSLKGSIIAAHATKVRLYASSRATQPRVAVDRAAASRHLAGEPSAH